MIPLSVFDYIVLFLMLAVPCALYLISVYFYREANQGYFRIAIERSLFFKRITVCVMLVINLFVPLWSLNLIGGNGLGMILSLPAILFIGVGLFLQGALGRKVRAIGCILFILIHIVDGIVFFTTATHLVFGGVLWLFVLLSGLMKKHRKGLLIAHICVAVVYLLVGIVQNIASISDFGYFSQVLVVCFALLLNCVATLLIIRMNQGEADGDFWKRYYLQEDDTEEREEAFVDDSGELTLASTEQPMQLPEERENSPDIVSGGNE